jgi:hypothetical protein
MCTSTFAMVFDLLLTAVVCLMLLPLQLAEARSGAGRREDFSDMVAARAAAQKRKLAQKADTTKKQKKDFKF